jgi:putative transposase
MSYSRSRASTAHLNPHYWDRSNEGLHLKWPWSWLKPAFLLHAGWFRAQGTRCLRHYEGNDGLLQNSPLRSFSKLSGPGIFDPPQGLVSGKIYAWKGGFAVKQKRFNVEQIVAVLKQAEAGVPLAELIRQVGLSEQTVYLWKKQYVGLEVDQVRQLKQLQEENTRLKQLVADLRSTRPCCRMF